MGERGYDSSLGRFLGVDSVEGGVDNDYGYVTDPLGSTDLSGASECSTPIMASANRIAADNHTTVKRCQMIVPIWSQVKPGKFKLFGIFTMPQKFCTVVRYQPKGGKKAGFTLMCFKVEYQKMRYTNVSIDFANGGMMVTQSRQYMNCGTMWLGGPQVPGTKDPTSVGVCGNIRTDGFECQVLKIRPPKGCKKWD